MLQLGRNITTPADQLQKIPVKEVYKWIVNPGSDLVRKTQHLRTILQIDSTAYRKQKTTLPYITCSIFHPPYRKTEHYAASHYFIFDFDNLGELDAIGSLISRFKDDSRTALCFRSPSGKGVKLLFALSPPCTDRFLYSEMYKHILFELATSVDLLDEADFRTHDVTRACFICHDPGVFYNPTPKLIDTGQMLSKISVESRQKIKEKELDRKLDKKKDNVDESVLDTIKLKLKPDYKPKAKAPAYVPEELRTIMPRIEQALEACEMKLISATPIHYGKKLKVGAGQYWAEVNIFFGKKGYSVVKTTKSGSNPDLAQLAWQVLHQNLIG